MEFELSTSHEGDVDGPARGRRSRRRIYTWIIFGLVGLMTGATWAAGVTSSTASVDTAGAAAAASIFGTSSGAAPSSSYTGLISENTALTIDLTGNWGRIDADTPVFDVDLSAVTGTYYFEVYLTNTPGGWAAFQIEFRSVAKACADAVAADWASPAASSVMIVENADAFASFDSLAGGTEHCIGVQAIARANDANGTFMRVANGSTPTAPAFAAVLNRSA